MEIRSDFYKKSHNSEKIITTVNQNFLFWVRDLLQITTGMGPNQLAHRVMRLLAVNLALILKKNIQYKCVI